MMTSPMAFQGASSSFPRWEYDVFLSFRGEDTRQSFTAHLYEALVRKKINTYIDDKLRRGEKISQLFKVIESSRISIIVLSKNYASSTWCLDELIKILECKESKQQKVLPVFYDVIPTDVRHQRKSFRKSLAKLKERLNDETKVQRWKAALTEVAGLSGFTLEYWKEPECIHEIVREVSRLLKRKYLNDVAKHQVGMESRVQDVHNKLLSVGVNNTRILGIYGLGGVGKTTLAKKIYNSFTDQFEDCCFLANVRETSNSEYGLIQLQETLLCEILGESSLKVANVDEGIGLIKKMLRSKRVLLVLDDLDQSVRVETLLGGCDWFGLGSIIIITTRDEHLLTCYDVHLRYKLKELDHDDALRLFCWNAFGNENPNHDFVELIEDILHYAGGLPLALIVLGLDLRGRDIHYWTSALEKFKKIPHNIIHEILKISYDSLDESEKNIFLDIACFFTGEQEEYVTKILDGCGFFPTSGIQVLLDKSLITFDEIRRLVMHDLLKDMGREIVRQESLEEPEKRSRLWFHEDVRYVLEEAKGTNKIQGILLELPKQDFINLSSEAFLKMKRLRIFINRNARFSRMPNYLSNELRVLHWRGYPSQSLPWNFHGKKLVTLRMDESLIKYLGNGVKNFHNLKIMIFSRCKFLTKISDVSGLKTLEKLVIVGCNNLVKVDHSVGFLDKLVNLLIRDCPNLTSFPRSLKLKSLESLEISFCKKLQNFPEIEIEMNCLQFVILESSGIKELPSSMENLTGLETLNLSGCDNLRHIPNGMLQLQQLRYVSLCCWSDKRQNPLPSIAELMLSPQPPILSSSIPNYEYCSSTLFPRLEYLDLPQWPLSELDWDLLTTHFSTLKTLDISGSNVVKLPEQIKRFVRLYELTLKDCKQLKEILELPPNIEDVIAAGCISLESFPEVSNKFEYNTSSFQQLILINLSGCHKMIVNPLRFEENLEDQPYRELAYPGNNIPDWDYHYKMTPNNYTCGVNVDMQYSDEIKGIITCAVVELDPPRGQFGYISIGIFYNGVFQYNTRTMSKVLVGSDHVLLHYHKLKLQELAPVEGSLQFLYYSMDKELQIKSLGIRAVCKQKAEKMHFSFSATRFSDLENESQDKNLNEDLDSEVRVGCEVAILDTLCYFAAFIAAKLQMAGRCIGLFSNRDADGKKYDVAQASCDKLVATLSKRHTMPVHV